MRSTLLLTVVLFLAVPAAPGLAQEVRRNASLSFPALSVGVGARAVGLGESFVAVCDDATAVYWNPAGLTQLREHQVSFSHHNYIQDSLFESVYYARPVGKSSGLGFSASYLDYGKFDRRDETGTRLDTFTPNDLSFSAAYALPLSSRWSAGLRTAWVRQTIDDYKHNGLFMDAGLLWRPDGKFRAGLDFKNLGVDSGGGNLPAAIKAGVSYLVRVGDTDRHHLTYTAGADIVPQSVSRANLGFEYCYEQHFCGRVGSIIDFASNLQDWKKGLSLGAGGRFGAVQADYAFTFGGELGDSHRLSLTGFWGSRSGAPRPSSAVEKVKPSSGKDKASMPVTLTFELPSPDCADPADCFEKALKLEKKNKKQEALRYYLKAVEKQPQQEAAWLRIGRLYFELGRESFEKALKANPDNKALQEWMKNQH